jgi:hypothetical protein
MSAEYSSRGRPGAKTFFRILNGAQMMGSGMWVAAESWMSCGHFSYEYFGRNEQRGLLFVFFSLVVKNEEAFCLSHWGGNFEAGSMPSTSRFKLMLIEGVTLRLPTRTLLAP